MAKKRTLLLGFAALLLFGVFSLFLTSSELAAVDRGGGGDPSHSLVVAEWRREDRDLLGARRNSEQDRRGLAGAPAVPPGLNVGRALAKYEEDGDAGRERLAGLPEPAADANRDAEPPGKEPQYRALLERDLEVQLNWTARLIASSARHGGVLERLETLGHLKNRELRVDTATRELWLYLRDQLHTLNLNKTSGEELQREKLLHSIKEQLDLLSLHTSEMTDTVDSLIRKEWRDKLSEEMSQLMQKRLHSLQNPSDCSEAQKLLCQVSKPCGFGCQIHHVAYCFIFAYATGRVLVVDSDGWRYSGNWDTVFQPLSGPECTTGVQGAGPWMSFNDPSPHKVIQVPAIESLGPKRPAFLPMAVPSDLIDRLSVFHGYPFVWFVGQFLQYLMRPSEQLRTYLEERRKTLNISHPIVGVHIRRTDKLQQEASYHSVEEYMIQVEEWYDRRVTMYGKNDERKVYLASDDKNALREAQTRYPNYKFISDNAVSKTAGELKSRYSEMGLFGVVLDVLMLSECDYIVCTLSSQVCRLAYELMQAHHTDASRLVYSLDDIYYFGGQQEHQWRAFHGKTNWDGGQMNFSKGDHIKIAGNHLNGFSLGNKALSYTRELFPSYKAEEQTRVADFPSYPKVH